MDGSVSVLANYSTLLIINHHQHLPEGDAGVVARQSVVSAPVEALAILAEVLGDGQYRIGQALGEGALKLLLHLAG